MKYAIISPYGYGMEWYGYKTYIAKGEIWNNALGDPCFVYKKKHPRDGHEVICPVRLEAVKFISKKEYFLRKLNGEG